MLSTPLSKESGLESRIPNRTINVEQTLLDSYYQNIHTQAASTANTLGITIPEVYSNIGFSPRGFFIDSYNFLGNHDNLTLITNNVVSRIQDLENNYEDIIKSQIETPEWFEFLDPSEIHSYKKPNRKWKTAAITLGSLALIGLASMAGCLGSKDNDKDPDNNGNGNHVKIDSDGDGFSDWFENEKAALFDPNIENNRYAILVDSINKIDNFENYKAWFYDSIVERAGFDKDNVDFYFNKNATFSNFKDSIEDLENTITENDLLFLLFQGHGNEIGQFKFYDDFVSYSDIDQLLDKLDYWMCVIELSACNFSKAIALVDENPRMILPGPYSMFRSLGIGVDYNDPFGADNLGNKDGYVSLEEAISHSIISENLIYYDPHDISKDNYLFEKYIY